MTRALFAMVLASCCMHPPADWPEVKFADVVKAHEMVCPETNVLFFEREHGGFGYVPKARFLVFSWPEVNRISSRYGWSAVRGIIAHELGHGCDDHNGRALSEESADIHAGCVLGLLGDSPEPLVLFLKHENTGGVHGSTAERTDRVRRAHAVCVEGLL